MSNVQDSRTTQQATYQRDLQHTPRQTPPAEKVIVVVHGVGDQSGNTTVQAVVNRVCAFHGEPGSVPLGRFPESAAFRIPSPWPSDLRQRFAFREVYWADVPRKLAQSNYPIEPPVRWGKSIVERLRLRARRLKSTEIKDDHFQLTEDVLSELIQALAVANKLVWVADRAGVGTVDLPKLLDDYLGDVQVVAEFEAQRATILGAFVAAMQEATASNPGADVYVVAHSEGTVVAMLALLEAFRADEPQPWAMQVRGLMTIGSPIDKHLVLWPELFDGYQPARKPPKPIAWRNYYDYGDPIGFQLDEARRWIAKQGWSDVFDFKGDGHDFGFSRYALPGKAHVDYWTDDGVFGHFLSTVVLDKQPPAPVPKSLPGIAPLSYVLPYLVNFAVFCVAGFVLFKSMIGAIAPTDPAVDRLRNVALGAVGLGTLLSGITVASRLPRLTRSVWWGAFAMAFGVACAVAYRWTVWNLYLPDYIQHDKTIGGVLWLAIGVVTAAFLVSVFKPRLGISPLLWLGAIGIATSMAKHLYDASQHIDLGPIWPVVLGGLGAIYLWWLGALMFDLVFVWHLYIRRGRIMQKMMELQIH